jgi:hypothetical protein
MDGGGVCRREEGGVWAIFWLNGVNGLKGYSAGKGPSVIAGAGYFFACSVR